MFALQRARKRHVLPVALAITAIAGASLTAAPPALAAPIAATGGTLTWGVDAGYRAVFATRTATAPASFVSDLATYPLATGSYDEVAGTGSLTFSGATRIGYLAGPPTSTPGAVDGNYFYLANPTVDISGGTATISGTTAGSSHRLNPELPNAAQAVRSVATVDLSSVTPTTTAESITWTAAPTAITAEGAAALAHYDTAGDAAATKRATGSALDPVTITVQRTAATTEPTPPVTEEPTDPEPTAPAPTDPTTPDPAEVATTTTVSVTPASPTTLGTASTVTAAVTATDGAATGTVSFYDIPATTGTKKLLGTADVADGKASFTSKLVAGGHQLSASFTGGDGFADSEATLSTTSNQGVTTVTNYGVVDATQPAACVPSGTTTTVDDVEASWDWSGYSSGWTKVASGDVTVDGQSFDLVNGAATASADCVTVDFTGTLRVEAYASFFPTHGQWVELIDPTLSIAKNGSGVWSAGVRTGSGELTTDTPVETVVATISGATLPDISSDGSASITLDYAGSTVKGTWSAGYSDAWSNAFLLQVPSAIRAFYYKSGTTAANDTKAASPIALAWSGAELPTEPGTDPTTPTNPTPTDPTETGNGNLAWGFKSSWRSYLSTIAAGTTTTSGGATIADDGRFVFPQAETGTTYDKSTGIGTIAYTGGVLFTSKAHGFAIGFKDPRIVFKGDGSTALTAETSTSDTAGLDATNRITLATISTATRIATPQSVTLLAAVAETGVWSDIATTFADTLQPDGWTQYQGTAADPVSFGYDVAAVDPGDGTTVGGGAGDSDGTDTGDSDTSIGSTDPVVDVAATDAASTQNQCVAQSVSAATLDWGIKSSFRSYVTGSIAKGSISTSGATSTGDGYRFVGGSGSVNPDDSLGRVAWSGGVTFDGHAGKLHLTISNPTVRLVGANSATLFADVSSKALSGPDVSLTQAAIATLSLSGGANVGSSDSVAFTGVPASLTATGASAFGGFYEAGVALDPVSFTMPLGATTDCDSTTDASLAFTGTDNVAGMVASGAGLLLAGLAAMLLRRRRIRA